MSGVTVQDRESITCSKDGFTVDAELVARNLGIPTAIFWRALKLGLVHSLVERGEEQDAGRTRLTFRYCGRSWSVTLNDATLCHP
jgi:hypothetical protein